MPIVLVQYMWDTANSPVKSILQCCTFATKIKFMLFDVKMGLLGLKHFCWVGFILLPQVIPYKG